MLEEPAIRGPKSGWQPRDLLCEAFSRQGLEVPELVHLAPTEVPEPFRGLLVHESDMTSTLSRYHGDSLVLKRLHLCETDEYLDREVVLCTKTGGCPVEYGVIRIMLSPFVPEAQAAIRSAVIPLGQILDDFDVSYQSRPSAFFSVSGCAYLDEQLQDQGVTKRFGRINMLRSSEGEELAKVLEILPGLRI